MIRSARRRMHGRGRGGESGLNGTHPQRPPAMGTSQIIRLTAVATLTVIAIVALLLFFVKIRSILLWVLIGIILAIALQPAVGWLVRHRWNRILAALVVSFVTIAVLAGAVVAIAWPVVRQSDDFIRALPHLVDLSLIHISEPTRLGMISYAVFCLKKKKKNKIELT